MTEPLLQVDAASFQYAGDAAAVGPFAFAAHAGEFHLISGPSGCGKSTLARMLAGVIPHLYRGHMQGRVLVGGEPAADLPLWQLSARVGLVSQNPAAQVLTSSVRDEIVFGLENLGQRRRAIAERLEQSLDAFDLRPLADRDPRTLSGGEQQRLVLAAIAARQPEVLVLDEPLSMLDTAATVEVIAHLQRLRSAGTAVVAFEHRRARFAGLPDLKHHELPTDAAAAEALPQWKRRVAAFRMVAEGVGVDLGGVRVLHSIDLELSGGEVLAVVGRNGAGKTTLLRALAGLQPHSGRISGGGDRQPPRLGFCFHNPDRQIFNPTVRQEILYGLSSVDERAYREVLELVGLARYEDTPPLLLSEGEKKRVALAIMLIRPGLSGICLDEPTLGQDDRHRQLLGEIVRHLAAAGHLCVVATHDLEWATRWADRSLLLQDGRVVACEKPRPPAGPRQPAVHAELIPPEGLEQCAGAVTIL